MLMHWADPTGMIRGAKRVARNEPRIIVCAGLQSDLVPRSRERIA